ncbi:MAG: helix-hairpin-helix domain-containing protein [Chlorobi bacterium]|nr:helix-hairpin-helix domain-containing protein [Chlorobiota bacterium]MCI0717334.1 helix-hairpin-helix domain-containing protein [Chlorobiota bacterium]
MPKFINRLGFTKRELLIIGFLLLTFIIGLIIRLSGWKKPNEYDYSSSDKKFEEQVKQSFSELEKNNLTIEQQEKAGELRRFSDSLIKQKDSPQKNKLPLGKKININLAYAGDLQLLPGIGEVTAERIIDYREQKGPFKKIQDIKKVKGIGDKKFEQMKDFITVE